MLGWLGMGEKNPFAQLEKRCVEVTKSSRYTFSRRVVEMLRVMFPPESASNINELYYEAVDSFNNKWIKKFKQLVEIFKPNGELGEALIVNREERTDLKSLNLGSEYQAYFGSKQAMLLLGIRKEVNSLTVPIFEGFFVKLMCSLFCFKQYEKRGSWKETFENDDFHYYILRNPILHIVREWLIYTRTRPVVFNRIINLMEGLVLRQPIFRFKKGENSLSIKSYHFYAVYLLIEWKTSNAVWEFLSFIVDYLESRQKNFNVLFVCWIRIHLLLLKRGSAYEMAVRRELQEGLFTLQLSKIRIPSIYEFGENISDIQDHDYLNHLFIQVDSLLSKELWTPTPLLLAAVLTVMFMLESIDPKQRKFQNSLMSQIGKVILKVQYTLKRKEDPYLQDTLQEIKGRFQHMGGNFEIDDKLDETMTQDNRNRGSLFSQNRGSKRLSNSRSSFVSYQRELSPWQKPLQASQSHMFFGLSFMIAQGIDRIKGVKQQYPSTNLRFLASFKTIAVLLAIILIMILLFH